MDTGSGHSRLFYLQDVTGKFRGDSGQTSRLTVRWRLIPVLCLMFLSLYGCTVANQTPTSVLETDIPMTVSELRDDLRSTSPATILPPTERLLPETLRLGLAPRWIAAGEAALASLPAGSFPSSIQLQAMQPTQVQLQSGLIDLALFPDSDGIPVASQALALVVPWTSEWEQLSLEQAQLILSEGSPYVAAVEWSQVTPTLKPLRIDGLHPSQPEYPLRENWSLHARPGLESIAQTLALALSNYLGDQLVHLTAVGDVMLARGLGEAIRSGEDPYPFAAVQSLLQGAELTIGNLETALGEGGRPEAKGYTFLSPPEAAEALALAGFDVLSLANNHAMDYGGQTLLEAIGHLKQQGLHSVGAGADASEAYAPLNIEVDDVKVAFLGFVDVPIEVRGFDARSWSAGERKAGVAWADPERMRSAIEAARDDADLVIVLLHSGYEYVSTPSPPQQQAAHLAIESGADLVIGHHAHVLQGVEFYQEGVIIYGLGNFAFDDGGVNDSGLMQIWIDSQGVRSLEFVPLVLRDDGRPIPADALRAEAIRSNFLGLTHIAVP